MAEAGTAEAGTSVTPTIGDETGDTDFETAALCGEWPKLDSSIARAGTGAQIPGEWSEGPTRLDCYHLNSLAL
jgi:hypothetical protein